MRSLRLLSEAVTCLELHSRSMAGPPLNQHVPAYFQEASNAVLTSSSSP